jgi:hypothetical protein
MILSDRLDASRLRRGKKRGWQAPIAHRSYVFEAIVFGAYIALLYKLDALGLVALLMAAFAFPIIRSHNWKISWAAAGFS